MSDEEREVKSIETRSGGGDFVIVCLLALILVIPASERMRYHEPVGSTTYLIVNFCTMIPYQINQNFKQN